MKADCSQQRLISDWPLAIFKAVTLTANRNRLPLASFKIFTYRLPLAATTNITVRLICKIHTLTPSMNVIPELSATAGFWNMQREVLTLSFGGKCGDCTVHG